MKRGLKQADTRLQARLAQVRQVIRDHLTACGREGLFDKMNNHEPGGDEEVASLINDIEFTTIQRELAELTALTAARKRIADGSYGTCMDCDEPIDAGRLNVQPAALRCLDCQELLERRNFVPG